MKRFISRLTSKKGFSLVECVMAIALFSVMAAMALRILTLALERRRENNEIVVDQNEQLELIASGAIFSTGVKNSSGTFSLTDNGGAGITLSADYASYVAGGDGLMISKPEYNLKDFEADLIHANFPAEYAAMTSSGNRFYSQIVLGEEVEIKKVSTASEEVLATPVTIDGQTYNRYYIYEISFEATGAGNYVTTMQMPKKSDGYLVRVNAQNATVRSLGLENNGLNYGDIMRVVDINDKVIIRLEFYYKSGSHSGYGYVGYIGKSAHNATLSDPDGNKVYTA